MTEKTIQRFGAYQIVTEELKRDAAVDLDAYLAARLLEQLKLQGGVPVGEVTVQWHEVTEWEEALSYYEGEPTIRAGDWRAYVSVPCIDMRDEDDSEGA